MDFSGARDLFVIIFHIPGSDCKFLDCGLIFEKLRGLNAKCQKLEFSEIIFLKETRGPSPRVVNQAGRTRSTMDRRHRGQRVPEHSGALIRVRPPAAPVHQSSPAGAQQRERGARGARFEPHRSSGGAVATRRWRCRTGRRRCSVRGLLRRGEREKGAGRGAVKLGEGAHLL